MSITRCAETVRTPKVLPIKTLLQVIVIFSAIMAFGIAHLYLRFSLNSLQTETNCLQAIQDSLQSEVKALKSKTLTNRQPGPLFDYARQELNMTACPVADRETITLPEDIHARYQMARAMQEAAPATEGAMPERLLWLEKLSERFGLISQALAGETEVSKKID